MHERATALLDVIAGHREPWHSRPEASLVRHLVDGAQAKVAVVFVSLRDDLHEILVSDDERLIGRSDCGDVTHRNAVEIAQPITNGLAAALGFEPVTFWAGIANGLAVVACPTGTGTIDVGAPFGWRSLAGVPAAQFEAATLAVGTVLAKLEHKCGLRRHRDGANRSGSSYRRRALDTLTLNSRPARARGRSGHPSLMMPCSHPARVRQARANSKPYTTLTPNTGSATFGQAAECVPSPLTPGRARQKLTPNTGSAS